VDSEELIPVSHVREGDVCGRLTRAFRELGEEIYLVGGTVRDRLLGRPSPDFDLATSAHPDVILAVVEGLHLGRPYRIGEKFGTIGLQFDEQRVEITTYRSAERYLAGSRKPEVRFGTSLLEDLRRRDFTVNAMAAEPLTGRVIDPLGGVQDLRAYLLRAVGEPADRFAEDPLRLLRAVRIAAELGFVIEPATWRAIVESAGELQIISRERVRDEYSRILEGRDPVKGLTLLRDGGLLVHSAPQLLELTRMSDHGPRHPLSLWDHTMAVVTAVPSDLVLRWAALLHDIAKPATRTIEPDGRPRFFHHEEVGAEMARAVLTSLRYPKNLIDEVVLLIETHMQIHSYSGEWSDGAIRRLCIRLGALLPAATVLARADGAGHSSTGTASNAPKLGDLERRIRQLGEDGRTPPRSPLSGDDLMRRYGRPPGPWIKAIKSRLEDEVIDGRLEPDDTKEAWKIADSIVRASRPGIESPR
jgi:poly(A) polymerase